VSALVLVGAQWGDEGKGKIVDLLAESADAVVRWAGGPNAGHTLVVGDERLVLRLVPSGALHQRASLLLGQGMAVNPGLLLEEIDELGARGIDVKSRLFLSDLAHLILPYHVLIDTLRETSSATRIGTTKRGIGPCYEDKIARRGVRAGDLEDPTFTRERVAEALVSWTPTITALGGEPPSVDEICAPLERIATRLVPLLRDCSALVDELVRADKRVLFEGAQGTLLDIDHGTYPFVTSSSAISGGACIGVGIGPTRIDRVIGISKAYATRVGEGPFPTELAEAEGGAHLREAGGEYGSVTGRPRRTGWLDLPALRHARRVNGLDGLVLTKLDVLSGLDEVKVCVAYDTPKGRVEELPVRNIGTVKPVYEARPGWKEVLSSCRSQTDFPAAVRSYLDFVEEQTGMPIYMVSVGARREDIVTLCDPFS
jgi:adenylosuccinate synthase